MAPSANGDNAASEPEREQSLEAALALPDPDPICKIRDGKIYRLEVVQQPQIARMCGYGDKVFPEEVLPKDGTDIKQDRRPISPPPCVRLVICDANTGEEVDYGYVSLFVCC